MEQPQDSKFEQWAILEIMGHQRYAGLVSEQAIGGTAFVRLDVPGYEENQPFTKLFGSSAIYAMTFVTEETARQAAKGFLHRPIDDWCAREYVRQADRLIESRPATEFDYDVDDEVIE